MSGIFRKSVFTDKEALTQFLENSVATVLSDESSHSLILLLKLNEGVSSPYAKLFFDEDELTIREKDVDKIVLKLVPINIRLAPRNDQKETIVFSKMSDKFANSFYSFESEVVIQKLVFSASYMTDFQMRAITPNLLISFVVNNSNIPFLRNAIHISEEPRTNRYTRIVRETHKEIYYDFLNTIEEKNYLRNNYKIGVILMEYLNQSKDFGEFLCVYPIKTVHNLGGGIKRVEYNYGTLEEYNRYITSKAEVLIAVDKCLFVGFIHNDLHLGNLVSYIDEETNENLGCIIDFGKASYFEFGEGSRISSTRPRNFNVLQAATSPIYQKDNYYEWIKPSNYLTKLIKLNSQVERNMGIRSTEGLIGWNDRDIKKVKTIDQFSEKKWKYLPADEMNELDAKQVARGKKIMDFLLKPGESIETFIALDEKEEVEKQTKNKKNGGYSLLKRYIEENGLDINCLSILITKNIHSCIDDYNKEKPNLFRSSRALEYAYRFGGRSTRKNREKKKQTRKARSKN